MFIADLFIMVKKLGSAQVSDRKMDKLTYSYNEIVTSSKKEQFLVCVCINIAKWINFKKLS